MRIITISREFGSGGRELGKRLAEALNIPCYDHQIIEMVAETHGFDKEHVESVSEKDIRNFYPTTIANRFMMPNLIASQSVSIAIAEHDMILKLAQQGDCVVVGRCADIICKDLHPFNIFVYADQVSKIARCEKRQDKNQNISIKELSKKIKKIDKERASYRSLFTEKKWGDKESYHLMINTSNKEIKDLIPALKEYVNNWFKDNK